FFSSRRRHTIFSRDWSSDVCSSDLTLKLKLLRKYIHLSEEDLAYQPGEEAELVARLAKRVKRDENYIIFTLQKGLSDLKSNRLRSEERRVGKECRSL